MINRCKQWSIIDIYDAIVGMNNSANALNGMEI